jgi:hypothetical protein
MGSLFSGPSGENGAAESAAIQAQSAREAAERDQQRWAQEQAQLKSQKEQEAIQSKLDADRLQQDNDLKLSQEQRVKDEEARKKAALAQTAAYDDTDGQLRKAKAAIAASPDSGLPGFSNLKKRAASSAGGYLGQSNTLASKAGVNVALGG